MIADLNHLLHRVMEGWSGSYDHPVRSVSNLATTQDQRTYIWQDPACSHFVQEKLTLVG